MKRIVALLTRLSVRETHRDKSTALVQLNGSKGMRKKLFVHLAKEAGSWKVDKVRGRD